MILFVAALSLLSGVVTQTESNGVSHYSLTRSLLTAAATATTATLNVDTTALHAEQTRKGLQLMTS